MNFWLLLFTELLRMWPPGIALDRICVKDYNLGKPNDTAERDFIVSKTKTNIFFEY